MLYFAYGSNLHHFQMKKRCKDSIFIKKIEDLPQKQLELNGLERGIEILTKNYSLKTPFILIW